MKRLAMLLVLFMTSTVMAKTYVHFSPADIKKLEKDGKVNITKHYTMLPGQALFEITCTANGDSVSNEFLVDNSSTPLVVPVDVLKAINEHNGFCILGPVNVELRKQQALNELHNMIGYLQDVQKYMNNLQKQREKLQGEIHTNPK